VLKWFNLGDWVAPGNLPPDEMVHTFYLWRCADLTAQAAKALGKTTDAATYTTLAEKTRLAFQKKFYNETAGTYGKAGGNIFALKMGLPAHQYERVVQSLKADIKANNGHLDTGIFGTQFFFEVLSENGMHDLAYEAMNKREEPGYGHWLELGATTSREKWDEEGSHNHPMFGGGLVWYYRKLAGMNTDSANPGYRHIIFRPQPVDDLTDVKYFSQTTYGEAGISWKNEKERFSMQVVIPVGCSATVHVPLLKGKRITEKGSSILPSGEITSLGEASGYRLFSIKSGKYHFLSE
jgi:alpha-L-rhamnosidase